MSKIPEVFISYSHDSLNHKKWVLDLAIRLRNNGINAILDQWELGPGDDLPHFMETHLESADKIIMICTEKYVSKANKGEGGVGYEKMILTSTLLKSIDSNKIIPIVKQKGSSLRPTFMKTKYYINFSTDDSFEFSFDELVRSIHGSPLLKKPEIGNNPFKQESDLVENKVNDSILELMKVVISIYESNPSESIIDYSVIYQRLNTSRIYMDTLLKKARELGYIKNTKMYPDYYTLEDKGRFYAIENNLI